MGKALCFTGHRPEGLPFASASAEALRFAERLYELVGIKIDEGFDTFLIGCARGADLMAGEAVLRWKKTGRSDIRLICVLPFRAQADGWSAYWRARWERALSLADDIVTVSREYSAGCFAMRNRRLVEDSDAVFAIVNGSGKGGTYSTIRYAMRLGREITLLDAVTLEVTAIAARER